MGDLAWPDVDLHLSSWSQSFFSGDAVIVFWKIFLTNSCPLVNSITSPQVECPPSKAQKEGVRECLNFSLVNSEYLRCCGWNILYIFGVFQFFSPIWIEFHRPSHFEASAWTLSQAGWWKPPSSHHAGPCWVGRPGLAWCSNVNRCGETKSSSTARILKDGPKSSRSSST